MARLNLKLDPDSFGLSNVMEKITKVRVKDCFVERDIIYFVVAPGFIGKALGKKGVNIKKVQQVLGKRIRVIEFSNDVARFVKNIIAPLEVENIVAEEGAVLIKDSRKKTKSLLMGRESRNLNIINRAVKRFFNVEVKII